MDKKQHTVRFSEELYDLIEQRAESLGMSVNQWLNHVAAYALATKSGEYSVTTKRTYKL